MQTLPRKARAGLNKSFYLSVANPPQCSLCTSCEAETGSFIEQKCTKTTDTICRCREGFVKWDNDSSTCKCIKGKGIKGKDSSHLECLKCEEGYFNGIINSKCEKWKSCDSAGVKVNGTDTTDVICHSSVSKTPTSTKSVPQKHTTHRPRLEVTTQHTTTAALQKLTSSAKVPASVSSDTGSYIGIGLVIFGIAGLLVLTALTCKMHVTLYWKKKPTGQKMNSICRTPVEEIGDVSDSSAKLNPGEP
ncbi:tumor necrosis factor receptor superfamily member 4 isoform X2 [Mugil cephalus]|uniref:tumor necrosis factor receptor superfamily member 4 isoform X2 n=1 Tax=Mugil cephalus TaxID=48193 RepID=UPI001FB577EC|nr:tumor necrosis factor receptor superfamily member 4 isoform X2 [Mugil cephalus]XP_047438142.1 tumor necrosis factor receptor superfamily member 4 isoform X2 [Mugil cephalus]